MWISLTLAGSLSAAIGVNLAQHLGAGRVATAKRTLAVGVTLAIIVLALLGLVIIAAPRQLAMLFSSADDVLDAFESVRYTLALTTVTMNLAVVAEGMLMSMGRTRTVLVVGLLGSWAGQVPAVAFFLNVWQRSLCAVYLGVSFGYALLCVLLFAVLTTIDWAAVSAEAQQRAQGQPAAAHVQEGPDPEESPVEPLPPAPSRVEPAPNSCDRQASDTHANE